MLEHANVGSIRDEMVRAQNVAKGLEDWVTELEAEKSKTTEGLQKMKDDHSATLEKLEKEIADLREKETSPRSQLLKTIKL